jgi:ketosteroid isomerase-like protein
MRIILLAAFAGLACTPPTLSDAERREIAATVETALREAYDLSRTDVAARMLALYPDSGRVVSANSGRVSASRDSLESGIRYFWDNVGVNMREPRWVWDTFHTDVMSRDAAVVTATYHIPHRNPRNEPHVLGGAMTVVFQKRAGKWTIIQEHLSDVPQAFASDSTATHSSH